MNLCMCGSLFDNEYPQCPRCDALQVLGLRPDATETEIRNAYRLFIKAWSPDSLQGDEQLKAAAEDKLKDIHAAFEYLTMTSMERAQQQRPIYLTARKASSETTPEAAPAPRRASPGYTTLVVLPNRTSPPKPWQGTKSLLTVWKRFRFIFSIAAFAFLILTGRSIWSFLRTHSVGVEQAIRVNGQQSALNATDGPKGDSLDASKQETQSSDHPDSVRKAAQNVARSQPANMRTTDHQAPAGDRKMLPYLTVGSTKVEVLNELGTPTAFSDDKLVYGKSELYLKSNSVVGWRIDPIASPIRVKLWPEGSVDTSLDFFTVGDSKDVVLVVQGTPTAFSEDRFEYGGSEVNFRNNRVVSWKNDITTIPLRARRE